MDGTGYVKQTKIHLSVFFWGVVINHGNRERQFGVFALFFRYASVNLARCQDEDTGVSFEYIYIHISESVWNFRETLRDKGMERFKAWYFLLFDRCT